MNNYNMTANTRETLARLFDTTHTNIAWAIRNGPEYPKNFDIEQISQHLIPFLTSIENGFQIAYNEAWNMDTQLGEAQQRNYALELRNNTLELRVQQHEQQALMHADTIRNRHDRTYQPKPQSPTKPHDSVITRSTLGPSRLQGSEPYREEDERIRSMLLDQSDLTLGQLPLDLRATNSDRNAILIQTHLSSLRNPLSQVFIETVSLVDTGSTAPAFADEDSLVKKYNITTKRLLVPKPLRLADGLPSGFITHYFTAIMTIGHHTEPMLFYVTKLSPSTPVILGMPWLKKHNPRPDFPALGLKFDSHYCAYNCLPWHIPDSDRVAPRGRTAQPTLRHRQPTVEEAPDTGEPTYAVNQAEILEDWTTTPPPRKLAPRGRTAQPTLRHRQPTVEEAPDTGEPTHAVNQAEILEDWTTTPPPRKQTRTETRAIETSLPQRPTSHPLPARTIQGRRLKSTPRVNQDAPAQLYCGRTKHAPIWMTLGALALSISPSFANKKA